MKEVIISDTVGKVVIRNKDKNKEVNAERYKKNVHLENGDIIETEKNSYALEIVEVGRNPFNINTNVYPNSKMQIFTKPEHKIILKNGLFHLMTNWSVELPLAEVTYTHQKYGYQDFSIFMVHITDNKVIVSTPIGGSPLLVKHKLLNKVAEIGNYEQAVLTKDSIKHENVDEKYREAFRTVRDMQYEQIDEIVNEQLLNFYKNLCQFQDKMAGGIEWAINLMTEEELVDYLNSWEKNLQKSLDDLPKAIKDEGKKYIKKALKEWDEHRKYLLETKFSEGDKKLFGMKGQEYLDLINEIKMYLPEHIYKENIRVYKQYQKIVGRAIEGNGIKNAEKEEVEKVEKVEKEPTELEKRLQNFNQEIEAGLAQLQSEISFDKKHELETEKKISEEPSNDETEDAFSEDKLAKLVEEINEEK